MTFRATPPTPSCRHMNRSANALPTSPLSMNLFALTVPTKSQTQRLNRCEPLLRHLVGICARLTFDKTRRSTNEWLMSYYELQASATTISTATKQTELNFCCQPSSLRRHCTTDSMITQTKQLESSTCILRQLTQFAVSGQTSFGTSSSRWPSRRLMYLRFSCLLVKQE